MKFIGFNFDKISVERFSSNFENLKINTNINISDIKEVDSDFLNTEERPLGVSFNYDVDYNPNFAKISLGGTIVVLVEEASSKEILKQWTNKNVPEDFRINIINLILRKSNIKALQLEEEMNLPLHISLPTIKKEQELNKD